MSFGSNSSSESGAHRMSFIPEITAVSANGCSVHEAVFMSSIIKVSLLRSCFGTQHLRIGPLKCCCGDEMLMGVRMASSLCSTSLLEGLHGGVRGGL